jgi:Fibronectin type III domain
MASCLTATPGNGRAVLTFTPPGDTGGSPITGYSASIDNGTNWSELSTTAGYGGTRQGTVTGLTNGVTYPTQVRAVTVHGSGSASSSASVTPNPTPPAAPTDVAATPGNGRADEQ